MFCPTIVKFSGVDMLQSMFVDNMAAHECITHYMLLETVTKNTEEPQEKYPLPQVCVSQAELPMNNLTILKMSSIGYRINGNWMSPSSNENAEKIYEMLSTNFSGIVEKVIVDVLRKNNDNYDKITIFQRGKVKDLVIDRCDYYYSLQCFCINLPNHLKMRAIQKMSIFMAKKNAHIALVAPGHYYGYDRKRNEIYTETNYSYRYQVYHRLAISLPLGRDPCREDTAWQEDHCTLRYTNRYI